MPTLTDLLNIFVYTCAQKLATKINLTYLCFWCFACSNWDPSPSLCIHTLNDIMVNRLSAIILWLIPLELAAFCCYIWYFKWSLWLAGLACNQPVIFIKLPSMVNNTVCLHSAALMAMYMYYKSCLKQHTFNVHYFQLISQKIYESSATWLWEPQVSYLKLVLCLWQNNFAE